jgi:predicted Zn-dependent peptidase
MGRPILGTSEIVQSLTSDRVKQYMHDHYGAKQMVLAAAGNIKHKDLVTMAEEHFITLKKDCAKTLEPSHYTGGEFRQERPLEQVHIVMGMEGLPYKHEDYYAASLLATILGGGMSSRLFQEIREKRGLVYSIYAFHSPSSDTGIFGIYAGTSQEKANELIEVTASELKHFSRTDFEADLKRAKAQVKAGLMMSLESTSSRCEQLANQMHIHGKPISPHDTLKKVDGVTVDHIKKVADTFFSSTPTFATLGPIDKVHGLEQLKKALG